MAEPIPITGRDVGAILARSSFTIGAVTSIVNALRKGKVRLNDVVAPTRGVETEELARSVVSTLDRVRRLAHDNESLVDRLSSRTRKLSEATRKQYSDKLAANRDLIADALASLSLRKRQIERIAEQVRALIERFHAASEAVRALGDRLGMDASATQRLVKKATENDNAGVEARNRLHTLGMESAELDEACRLVAALPRIKKQLESRSGVQPAELIEIHEALVRIAESMEQPPAEARSGKARTRGQAYVEDPRVRRCIERHAMTVASAHYVAHGFAVEDTSSSRPFDLLCRHAEQEVRVEVKGTRSDGDEVLVTSAEVLNARGERWRTDLFIVRNIRLVQEHGVEPVALGGDLRIIEGWAPHEDDLMPTQYRYFVRTAHY
jgi:hypothetical protein